MSNWQVLAKPYYTDASLTDTSQFQPVKFAENTVLKAVMLWVVVFGDPTFTSLNLKIYSNDDEQVAKTPKKLLYTSTNSWLKADVHTEDYACRELYFEFANVNLRRDTWFNFVLGSSGYSGASVDSHLAWKLAFPDPQYSEDVTTDAVQTYPLTFVPIAARYDKQ